MSNTTTLQITSDPSDNREILEEMIKQLRGPDGRPSSREVALAVTKLQEARFWLGESLYGLNAVGWLGNVNPPGTEPDTR